MSFLFRNARGRLNTVIAGFVLVTLVSVAGPAAANPKYAGLVIDVISGETLYADSADELRYPASLTKIMTLYIVFEELKAGRLRLDDRFTMSEYASARPPSKIGIPPGGTIKVRDAIKALVTKSANDVATAVGENIEGSEAKFAKRMTRTAKRLGMERTRFYNASGLPHARQKTTARDMARLGIAIQRDFPEYYGVFQTRVFEFRQRRFGNHNRLLGRVEGVDGIKTGFIRASGFNLVTSVRRDGRHLVAVVMGGRTGASRNRHMTDLIARTLPKATRGSPMKVYAWNDRGPPPVPRTKPLRELYLARLKAQQVETASASVGGDAIAGLLAFAEETRAAAEPAASGALQAVIAQATPDAVIASAPLPSTDDVQRAVVRPDPVLAAIEIASKDAGASRSAEPGAGTQGHARGSDRIGGAFATLTGAEDDTGIQRLIAAYGRRASAPDAPVVAIGSQGGEAAPRDERGWQIQVGAVPSAEKAEELQETSEAIAPDLKARARVTSEVRTSDGTMFRARFAGFASREQAQAVCKRFANHNRPCWAVSM